MTVTGYIVRNALRNKRRCILTISSVALSMLLFTLLQVFLKGLTQPETTEAAAQRIVVRHKVSLANMLFSRYKREILELQGVEHCTKLLWFGGIYQDPKNFFPQFACDPESVFEVLSEAQVDPNQLEAFQRDRTGCMVGVQTMERFGWEVGDRIQLMGAMWPCDLELTIRGVYSGSADETNLFFHHEYFDQLMGDKGFTGLFWVKVASAEWVPRLIERIDAKFENSDAETRTETEQTFQLGFVSMLGNVKMLIGSISTVIVFSLFLVTAGTMGMTIRERFREIALMKALGFARYHLFALITAESFVLAVAGGVIGCGGAALILYSFDFYKLSRGLFVSFGVTPHILACSLLAAAFVGIISALGPAWTGVRRDLMQELVTPE